MDGTVLLTDDEVVALCVLDGRPWPLGLITVDATAADLARAGARGLRSLFVRQLLVGADGVTRAESTLAAVLSAFLDAKDRVGAYVAPAVDHSVLGGMSVGAARTDTGWLLDTVTADGVHAFRYATADAAASTVRALAQKAYTGELFGAQTGWVCVLRFGVDGQNSVAVARQVATGVVDGVAVDGWTDQFVTTAFAAPSGAAPSESPRQC